MPTIQTAKIATSTALMAASFTLSACGGDAAGPSQEGGTYINTGWGGTALVVDGDSVTEVAVTNSRDCTNYETFMKDIEGNDLDPGSTDYKIEATGTLNEERTTVLWDIGDGKVRGIAFDTPLEGLLTAEMAGGMGTNDEVFATADTDQGKAAIGEARTQFCG